MHCTSTIAMTPPAILLTSFGSFPGARTNPSGAVAALAAQRATRRLQRLGVRLVCAKLPVVFDAVAAQLAGLQSRHSPRAVLHLGLAASRKCVTPEARAVNRLTLRHADAAGRHSATPLVDKSGPAVLRASLHAASLARVVGHCGVAARVSRSAGDYVCNQTLYLSLLHSRRTGARGQLVGFIHLPRPGNGQQPLSRAITRRAGLRAMARAIEACLMLIAARLRGPWATR